jgi:hypothetical protein
MTKSALILTLVLMANYALAITGTEVAQKIYNSNRETDSIQKVEMTLTDKKGNNRTRTFVLFAKDNNKYDSQSLIEFLTPKKIKKTGMLTHNSKGSDSSQWIYLPALKKTRRIASSKKSGRFVGSDLTYEDLEDREVELDNHKILKKDKVGKITYYVIQSKAKDKSTSMYSKVVSWVNPKTWMVKKAFFYKKKKKPYKTLLNKEIKKIGKSWRATYTIINNKKLKHKTTLKILSTKFDNKFNKNIFRKSILENAKKLKKYLK